METDKNDAIVEKTECQTEKLGSKGLFCESGIFGLESEEMLVILNPISQTVLFISF